MIIVFIYFINQSFRAIDVYGEDRDPRYATTTTTTKQYRNLAYLGTKLGLILLTFFQTL